MLISTVFMWLSIALGFVVGLPALWLCREAMFPVAHERGVVLATVKPWKSLLVGLVPFALALVVTSKLGTAGLAAVLPLGGLLLWTVGGSSSLAAALGRQLWPYLELERPWKQTMRGGFIITGALLIPVVGWFVLLPLLLIFGWGVSLRSWWAKRQEAKAAKLMQAVETARAQAALAAHTAVVPGLASPLQSPESTTSALV